MDAILQGIPRVICYLDDVLVTGVSNSEHLKTLEAVLKRLCEHAVWLKRDKCAFFPDAVEYLGHRIDASGVHTSSKKVSAITEAPAPWNIQELRSFLGLINYYAKFIPNLASCLHPLYNLLRVARSGRGPSHVPKSLRRSNESSRQHLCWPTTMLTSPSSSLVMPHHTGWGRDLVHLP